MVLKALKIAKPAVGSAHNLPVSGKGIDVSVVERGQ
jgi:hypothetical protein